MTSTNPPKKISKKTSRRNKIEVKEESTPTIFPEPIHPPHPQPQPQPHPQPQLAQQQKSRTVKENIKGGNGAYHPSHAYEEEEEEPPKQYNFTSIFGIFHYLHDNVLSLNNSKFFAGIIMIMLNVGSKFISIQFSKSTEEYLKYTVTKQLLVFAMAWLGTRDIYTALILVAIFTVLSDHLFNEESHVCVVPEKYRVLHTLDKNEDGLTESDINSAMITLNKANKIMKQMMEEENKGQGPIDSHLNPYSANYIKT